MSPKLKAALVMAGVFALGGVAGAAGSRAYVLHRFRSNIEAPTPEARSRFRLEAMKRHLDLSDDQVTKLDAIFRDADAERDKRMEACRPGMEALRGEMDAKIMQVLRPDQQERFRELASHHGPFGGPPPPPPHPGP